LSVRAKIERRLTKRGVKARNGGSSGSSEAAAVRPPKDLAARVMELLSKKWRTNE